MCLYISQVIFMSSIVSTIIKVLQTLCSSRKDNAIVSHLSNEMQIVLPVIPQTPSTPTQIMYQEDTTNSTMSTSKDDLKHGKLNVFISYIFIINMQILQKKMV